MANVFQTVFFCAWVCLMTAVFGQPWSTLLLVIIIFEVPEANFWRREHLPLIMPVAMLLPDTRELKTSMCPEPPFTRDQSLTIMQPG